MSLDHFAIEVDETDRYVVAVSLACRVCSTDVLSAEGATLPQLIVAADRHECGKAEALAKLERARREYERLQAELGMLEPSRLEPYSPRTHEILVSPSSPPASVTVDGEEKHYAFKHPGPRHPCKCNRVFDTAPELAAHQRQCAVAHRHRHLDGHAEPGSFVWGRE